MLPRLRKNRTRWPFAETSKFSLDVAPVEHHRVGAVLTFDDVAAVARIPLEDVVVIAEQSDVVALVAVDEVVAGAASSMSAPLPPRIVSLPAPPSTLIAMSAARLPVAVNVSLPPLALSTRFSVVPMSTLNGAGLVRSNRTRVPFGSRRREHLGTVATVDLCRVDAVAAFVEVGVVAGVPDHQVVAGFAERLIVAGRRP